MSQKTIERQQLLSGVESALIRGRDAMFICLCLDLQTADTCPSSSSSSTEDSFTSGSLEMVLANLTLCWWCCTELAIILDFAPPEILMKIS